MTAPTLARVVGPNFTAGIELRDGTVTRCAPIVKILRGMTWTAVQVYAKSRGWNVEALRKEGN